MSGKVSIHYNYKGLIDSIYPSFLKLFIFNFGEKERLYLHEDTDKYIKGLFERCV